MSDPKWLAELLAEAAVLDAQYAHLQDLEQDDLATEALLEREHFDPGDEPEGEDEQAW